MLSLNETLFAAVGFGDLHRDGMTMAVVCVRATYDLSADGSLHLSETQENIYSDVYADRTESAPLLHATDLIGYKPAADVTVLGDAHAPHSKPAESWTVAIGVGRYGAVLRVHGPRQWEPTLKLCGQLGGWGRPSRWRGCLWIIGSLPADATRVIPRAIATGAT